MQTVFLLFAFFFFGNAVLASPPGGPSASKLETTKPAPAPPVEASAERFALLRSLSKLSSMSLPKGRHCDFTTTSGKPPASLGEWMAWNLSFFDGGQQNEIRASCKPAGDKRPQCEILFLAWEHTESSWDCGFRFETTKAGEIIKSTLECIGSC